MSENPVPSEGRVNTAWTRFLNELSNIPANEGFFGPISGSSGPVEHRKLVYEDLGMGDMAPIFHRILIYTGSILLGNSFGNPGSGSTYDTFIFRSAPGMLTIRDAVLSGAVQVRDDMGIGGVLLNIGTVSNGYLAVTTAGVVGISGQPRMSGLTNYANNVDALAGGHVPGDLYYSQSAFPGSDAILKVVVPP